MGNENSIKTLSPHPQTTNYCNFINKFTKIFITFQHKTVHIQNLLLSNPSENVQRIWRILGGGAGHGTGRHKAPWITFNDEAPLIMFWRFIIYFKAANLALRSNAWELREIYPVFVFPCLYRNCLTSTWNLNMHIIADLFLFHAYLCCRRLDILTSFYWCWLLNICFQLHVTTLHYNWSPAVTQRLGQEEMMASGCGHQVILLQTTF